MAQSCAYKVVCIQNLPADTLQTQLLGYLVGFLGSSASIEITSFCALPESREVIAFVDVGDFENVQRCIRNLNDTKFFGRRIRVSMLLPDEFLSQHASVVLSNIPLVASAADLYDLLSKLGGLVSIHLMYEDKIDVHLGKGIATFFTERDAQFAISSINSRRAFPTALLAELYRPPRGEENQLTAEDRHEGDYDDDASAVGGSDEEGYLTDNSSDSEEELPTFAWSKGGYLGAAVKHIPAPRTIPSDPNPVPGNNFSSGGSDEEEERAEHQDEQMTNGKKLYEREYIVMRTEEDRLSFRLRLDMMSNDKERKTALAKHFWFKYKGLPLSVQNNKVFEILIPVLPVSDLLAVGVEEPRFLMCAKYAEIAIKAKQKFLPPLTVAKIRLRLQLDFETKPESEQKRKIRNHLYSQHLGDSTLKPMQLEYVLQILCNSMDVEKLLKLACKPDKYAEYELLARKVMAEGGDALPNNTKL